MALKRPLPHQDLQLNKRRHLLSTLFKGVGRVEKMEEFVHMLEPMIREWVREAVNQAIQRFLSGSWENDTVRSESRNLWLKFEGKLPTTVFTGNKIVSQGSSNIKIRLYDRTTQQTVTSGPYSSMKVRVVVVEDDFVAEEEWSKMEFESKVVESRQGKRPLLTGDLIVSLNNGQGYINQLCVTDNSSWIRSGKFRLGLRVCNENETAVGEGISNAFKVLDHRGESYQKLYPPELNSEVWRLEKIAKGGAYDKKLSKLGITTVGDFLRCYAVKEAFLRAALHKISSKKWERIIAHAKTCIIDDKKYIYRDATGAAALLFDSVYRVIAVTFDARTFHSVDGYQMTRVEDLKQRAYADLNNWEFYQGEVEMKKDETQAGSSSSSLFELGESSQGFSFACSNSFGVADYIDFEEHEHEEMANVQQL